MRVAFDVRPLQVGSQYRGVGTYVRELLTQFLERRREIMLMAWPEIPIALDRRYLNLCQVLEIPKSSNLPVFQYMGFKHDGQKNFELFKKIASYADIIHFTDPQDLRYGFPWEDVGVPRVLTVHDLMTVTNTDYIFTDQNFIKKQAIKFLYNSYIQHYSDSDGIIADSQYTERVLQNVVKTGLPATKPIWLGIPDNYVIPYVSQIDEYRLQRRLPPHFILHTGAIMGNKNVEALLQATAPKSPWPFVFAGPYTEADRDYLAGKYPQQQIFWLGYVDREELPMLHAAASIFAFPSLMEGFGLPVLEAMAVGTPVICSNTASLPEVVGNAAITFDPRNLNDIRNALYTVMNDENLRKQMRTRGLERAQHLSWRRTADTTWMAYEEFVETYSKRKKRRSGI